MPTLAQVYENHAEECLCAAAKADDPKQRALLLKLASAWREDVDDLTGPWGIEIYDEGLQWVELANRHGLVDLWDIILGGAGHDAWGEDSGPSRFYKSNHQAPWNKEVKRISKVPVVGVGRFTDPDEMVRVIKSGQLDIIGCARPSIADPWLPRKIDEGRLEDICECIGCNVCISRFNLNSTIICTQNPTAMEEYRRGWHPEIFAAAPRPTSVLVVGAGPSGMECARILALRGYSVDLCEADETLGGHLRDVVKLPGLAEWNRVVTFRESQLPRMPNVKIMRGTGKITADGLSNTAPRASSWRPAPIGSATGSALPDPIPCRASTWGFPIA